MHARALNGDSACRWMRSGEVRRSAGRLLTEGTELCRGLSGAVLEDRGARHEGCGKGNNERKRGCTAALGVRAGRIRVSVLMATRVILTGSVMTGRVVAGSVMPRHVVAGHVMTSHVATGDSIVTRIVARVRVQIRAGICIAQHHREPPINGREHEAGGNERAKQQHRENDRHGPMTLAPDTQPHACAVAAVIHSLASHLPTMPQRAVTIKVPFGPFPPPRPPGSRSQSSPTARPPGR